MQTGFCKTLNAWKLQNYLWESSKIFRNAGYYGPTETTSTEMFKALLVQITSRPTGKIVLCAQKVKDMLTLLNSSN